MEDDVYGNQNRMLKICYNSASPDRCTTQLLTSLYWHKFLLVDYCQHVHTYILASTEGN